MFTDLLTMPCWMPGGAAVVAATPADTAETGGGGTDCGVGTDGGAWAPALCGASCGVVLCACCKAAFE